VIGGHSKDSGPGGSTLPASSRTGEVVLAGWGASVTLYI